LHIFCGLSPDRLSALFEYFPDQCTFLLPGGPNDV
jgi:hypothetical protein